MKKFSNLLGKRGSQAQNDDPNTPEGAATRGVHSFCDSGSSKPGEEVLHLPAIVDAAESSPKAAAAAAYQIRKFLSRDYLVAAHRQYNAVMILRILADNPGPSFTKNIDEKFVETVNRLLRQSRDPSVQQIMRETLQHFDTEKKGDTNLQPLMAMWKKERTSPMPFTRSYAQPNGHPAVYQQQGQATFNGGQPHSNGRPKHQLPEPGELAGRIEEAKTSSKLLIQLVQSTPTEEFDSNELIKEFADRCQSAQRNLQGYMNCTDPAPDENTLQTLIEACEQLSVASSKHQRAKLAATRHRNSNMQSQERSQNASPNPGTLASSPPPQQSPRQGSIPVPSMNGAMNTTHNGYPSRNPFSDENRVAQRKSVGSGEGRKRFYAAPTADHSPPLGTVELQGNDTPVKPQQLRQDSVQTSHPFSYPTPNPSLDQPIQHPQGKSPVIVDDEDLYSSSPTSEINPSLNNPYPPPRNPGRSAANPYDRLSSLDPQSAQYPSHRYTSSYPPQQQPAVNGAALHPGATLQSDDRGQGEGSDGRVKDDAPMPTVSVSGSGWKY